LYRQTSDEVGKPFHFEATVFIMEKYPTKILIVDDAPDFCESLAWLLHDDGYECKVAGNGQEALEMLGREKAQLILLDWEMPIMNGAGFLKSRNRRSELLAIPVLILSGSADIAENAARFKARFLQKPLDYVRLLSTMQLLLEEQIH
jgi:DNA-binding response OmpR family regulator